MELKNKFVVVTGASTGIGRVISIAFAKEGANLILIARSKKELDKTVDLCNKAGGRAKSYIVDLSEIKSINDFVSKIKSEYKQINVLINVAGVWHGSDEVYAGKAFEIFSQKIILDTFNVGTIAPTLLSHAFISFMSEGSKIINLSGTFESGAKGWIPYYVSKRAIEDLTVGLSQELKDKNIQVNCISPSDTATEAYQKYFPQYISEAIDPKEIAKFAVYLCSKEADNFTGKVFVLKKGKKPIEYFHF